MSFSYANAGSGQSAGGIGWFNFNTLALNPGTTIPNLTGTLADGTVVTFDISLTLNSGDARAFVATQPPSFPTANFGVTGYTGIVGNVILNQVGDVGAGNSTITLSNIAVKDADGGAIPNYSVIVADAERTSTDEMWTWASNGGNWSVLTMLGINPPTLTGIGTQTTTIQGAAAGEQAAYVLTTSSPTTLNLTVDNGPSTIQGIAIGFAVTKMVLQKNIGSRIDPSDQFVVDIAGTPNDQATTTGSALGVQPNPAFIYAIPGSVFTIDESMASGSSSALIEYTQVVSGVNTTPGGNSPTTGGLPILFTPILGDDITYTIFNTVTVPEQNFIKRVDKAYADLGDVLTYTITINNPDNVVISDVLVVDETPAGTTYLGNLAVSNSYTGTSLSTGITIATIPANTFATITWQVQVGAAMPITTPIVNAATITIPGGISGNSNVVRTQVRHADLISTGNFIKTTSKIFANFGDEFMYTLILSNTGNTPAFNIVLQDAIPAGAMYVANSIAGNVLFTGTPNTSIALESPIAAGGSATISFLVKVKNSIPSKNPLINDAIVNYAYTVDPYSPNGVENVQGISNTVTTTISTAKLIIEKTTDQTISYIGNTLLYSFVIRNIGNVAANNVELTDIIGNGTMYIPGSLIVSVPYMNVPPTGIILTNPIEPGDSVIVSFQVKITNMPIPNPIVNVAKANFTYTLDPLFPNGEISTSASNSVSTLVFRYNYAQQINDLLNSIALEEAALASIIDSEGKKIQKMVAMDSMTQQELLCLNKSVTELTESITLLEGILKQKLSLVDCQINGKCN